MNAIKVFRILGPIDARNIFRDSSIKWMIFLPLLMAIIIRWGVPPLTVSLEAQYGFDLTPYYPAILSYFFVAMCPFVFSMLVGFVLLDERDDNTLTALSVTPLSLNTYFAYRISMPIVLTIVLMFIIFPIAAIGTLPPEEILITAIAAAPTAPMFALFLATVAQNKVQGFALMKLAGMPLLAPIFGFFVDGPWEYAFGIVPTYWPMKVYWMLEAGQAGVWLHALVAVVYQSLIIWLLVKRFNKIMHS